MNVGPIRNNGFTLIEVVIAFALFALCLGALYETFAGATRRTAQARDREMAWLLAQSVLAEVRSQPSAPDVPRSGRKGGFEWQIRTTPQVETRVGDVRWHPYEVVVQVAAASAPQRGVELRSIEWFRSEP